jgi:hypothetical protein
MITNKDTGTRLDEVGAGIYRICTPLDVIPGGFTFNSYLVADDEPLLFHTGYRKLFPITSEAIAEGIRPQVPDSALPRSKPEGGTSPR